MAISKPTVRASWADSATPNSADIKDPDTVTAGFVAAGWPLSSTPPARNFFNFVLNYCMNGVRYLCRRSVADWDSAETYSISDVALGSDGQVYQSLIASNINQAPPTTPGAWGPLKNYITASALASALAGFVTTAALNAALSAYVTAATLASTLASYVTNSSLASTLAGYATTVSLAATNAALASEAATARNGAGITGGTVAAARLPLIGNLSGVVIMADPGGTPTGFPPGTMVFYF